jgi:hypothetical protein
MARDRRDRALEREANARERARRNREREDGRMARLHEAAANAQADAAHIAERRRAEDVEIEGEMLGEPEEEQPLPAQRP